MAPPYLTLRMDRLDLDEVYMKFTQNSDYLMTFPVGTHTAQVLQLLTPQEVGCLEECTDIFFQEFGIVTIHVCLTAHTKVPRTATIRSREYCYQHSSIQYTPPLTSNYAWVVGVCTLAVLVIMFG